MLASCCKSFFVGLLLPAVQALTYYIYSCIRDQGSELQLERKKRTHLRPNCWVYYAYLVFILHQGYRLLMANKSQQKKVSSLDLNLGFATDDGVAKDILNPPSHSSQKDPVHPSNVPIQTNRAESNDAPDVHIHLAQICQRLSSIENNVIFIKNYIEKKIHDEANLVKYDARGSASSMKLQNRQVIHSGLLKKE